MSSFAYWLAHGEFDRLVREQGAICPVCEERRTLVVDHDHKTDEVRGLLCQRCNGAIGALGDDTAGLMRAIAYLERPRPDVAMRTRIGAGRRRSLNPVPIPPRDDLVFHYTVCRKSMAQIAEEYETGEGAVRGWLRKYEISRRTHSSRIKLSWEERQLELPLSST